MNNKQEGKGSSFSQGNSTKNVKEMMRQNITVVNSVSNSTVRTAAGTVSMEATESERITRNRMSHHVIAATHGRFIRCNGKNGNFTGENLVSNTLAE